MWLQFLGRVRSESGHIWKCEGLFWQSSTRLRKAICVTLRCRGSRGTISGTCSFEMLHTTLPTDATCPHLEGALRREDFMAEVRRTMHELFAGNEEVATSKADYFGRALEHREADVLCPVIDLVRSKKRNGNERSGEGETNRDADIWTAPLTLKSKTSWYFSTAFEAIERIFVPLVWEKRRRVSCLMCRKTNSGVGCAHEADSKSVVNLIRAMRTAKGIGQLFPDEDGYQSADEGNEELLRRADEVILDLRNDSSESSSSDDEQHACQVFNSIPTIQNVDHKFGEGKYCTNMKKRSPFYARGK